MPTFGTPNTNLLGLSVDVSVSGLTVGTRYDIYRLTHSWDSDDDVYQRIIPDRRTYWSALAHRIGWEATATTRSFRDYEAPMKPFKYFIVPTNSVAPFEWNWANGDYPISRGVLSSVVHLQREQDEAFAIDGDAAITGSIVLRSTSDLSLWADACLFDMDTIRYTARGTEFPVIGRQYPIYVADSREARRGTMTLKTESLTEYEEIRNIVFPQSGRISPVWMHAVNENVALLDDMLMVPLDIDVEQAGKSDADRRFITIDFVEVDPVAGLPKRTGDNDDLTQAPKANFAASTYKPKRNQQVTLTDTSTGQITNWTWTISRLGKGKTSSRYGEGPHKVSWGGSGSHWAKLRVWGPEGASTITRRFTVTK